MLYNELGHCATRDLHRQRSSLLYSRAMESVAVRLKALRESVRPKLTIRQVAEELGFGESHNRYAYYEDAKRFRKEALPLHLAKQIADVFEKHGIDREDVLRLAGVADDWTDESGGPGHIDPQMLERLNLAEVPDASHNYSMGAGAFLDVAEVTYRYFDKDWLRTVTDVPTSGLVFVRGVGDSMLPTIHEDDAILINTAEFVIDRQDKIWALIYGGLGMIKRVRSIPSPDDQPRFLIISDNPAVENFEVSASEIAVRGRVVWVSRRV